MGKKHKYIKPEDRKYVVRNAKPFEEVNWDVDKPWEPAILPMYLSLWPVTHLVRGAADTQDFLVFINTDGMSSKGKTIFVHPHIAPIPKGSFTSLEEGVWYALPHNSFAR